MATTPERPLTIAIVGTTASGKTELAIKVAKEFGGEIICADSRTIYKGMNIGTAKPTEQQQKEVIHYGLDLIDPGQRYSAAKFKKYALNKIRETQEKEKLPILVGGTGLYIDSVLYDFEFSTAGADRDPMNPRHQKIKAGKKNLAPGVVLIGLMPNDKAIKQNIKKRAEQNFTKLIGEVKTLLSKFTTNDLLAGAAIAYKSGLEFIAKKNSKEDSIKRIASAEWQYARRQKTWFKKNKDITWFSAPEEAFKFLENLLSK